MQIHWRSHRFHSFTAKAAVKRRPELHHLHWRAAFAPVEIEPWQRYENFKLTFGEWDLDAENDFWAPPGRWTVTANAAAISPENAIEILLEGAVVATLTAPLMPATFATAWDTGGHNLRLTARLTGQPLDAAEVGLYYEAQFDTSGQPPRFRALDDLFVVDYPDVWSDPYQGVLTVQPVLYDGAGVLLEEGPVLTLTTAGQWRRGSELI